MQWTKDNQILISSSEPVRLGVRFVLYCAGSSVNSVVVVLEVLSDN